MKFYLVKPAGGLLGQSRKAAASRAAVIVSGAKDTAEELRSQLAALRSDGASRYAIASRETPRSRLRWVEGDAWMLTDLQRARLRKP